MIKRFLLLALVLIISCFSAHSQVPFGNGLNLSNWFQEENVREINFSKYTKQDFVNIKSLGCDVVRLPLNLHSMTQGAPDYIIEPLFYELLDEVVGWAYETDIHLILDNHSFKVNENTDPSVVLILEKVWKQMAAHYKNSQAEVYYEVLNEPHGIDYSLWNEIQREIIDVIRTEDTIHTIIVGGTDWNSYLGLKNIFLYSDQNLIYTFHFYEPFIFTHQGASWNKMEDLGGVPFPYDPARMPVCPENLLGQWQEEALNRYAIEGTIEKVKELIDIASDFKSSKGVTLYCGELGVLMDKSDPKERVFWYKLVTDYLNQKGIFWTIWDYHGSFGVFEKNSYGFFESDLDTALIRNLGWKVPEQTDYFVSPDYSDIEIYSDFLGTNILKANYMGGGFADYYSSLSPENGRYNIEWTGSDQYGGLRFDFYPERDLSFLKINQFNLDFYIRGNTPGTKLQVRFVDSKTGENDRPWRMSFDVDENITSWDGNWHHLIIPLNTFKETGSWDNGWMDPQGLFDWTSVDIFEIIAEQHSLKSIQIGLDKITVSSNVIQLAPGTKLSGIPGPVHIFPNPSSRPVTILFDNSGNRMINISVINTAGEIVKEFAGTGNIFIWDLKDNNNNRVADGIYLCRILSTSEVCTRKITIKKGSN